MFESSENPRVFGLPPGADFPAELVAGVLYRMQGQPPEALARVTVLVNTRRMQRRLKDLFSQGPARLLPRIGLVTDLDALLPGADLPAPVTALRRRLELTSLVSRLLELDPSIAPRAASTDLADSLAALMDEMQGEGVGADTLINLDISDQSGHWARSLKFLSIVHQYATSTTDGRPDPEALRRLMAEELISRWADAPPEHPVIIAGSTGSRATTSLLMQAAAKLPLGAVVLPGFDFDMPAQVWRSLLDTSVSPLGSEDHPQYRFADFLNQLDMVPDDVGNWGKVAERQHRNELISLSLRPAPVTDQWRSEGPKLDDLVGRSEGLTLIEAPQPKDEALAIAVAMRSAVEERKSVALITPDRTLGRRVSAALQRWNIVADDSAGRPLSLTAPGRFLRQVANMIGREPDPVDLIALLKHPLAHSGREDRGPHLRLTREFELFLRRAQTASVTGKEVQKFREKRGEDEHAWCQALLDWLHLVGTAPVQTLVGCLTHHIIVAESLAAGGDRGSGQLWEETAGRDALALVEKFRGEAEYDAPLPFAEYHRLFEKALTAENTRNYDTARPDVMIWGTLEARVQGADVVILGGLNEDTWPAHPSVDPWLNRSLRRRAGLLLPERQIGLSAHDYQQAAAAKEVIFSRAKRDADSETVSSRWLSRLTNLLQGLKDQNGPVALEAMRSAGAVYLDMAAQLDAPAKQVDAEPRPAPAPPRDVRPKEFAVTEIQRLIRDPYAIYAKRILRLSRLEPLRAVPDARVRGNVFHAIMEDAFSLDADFSDLDAAMTRLMSISAAHFAELPWPGVAALWAGHLESIAEVLVADEAARRVARRPIALERKGRIDLPGTKFSLSGKADRIDKLHDGRLVIYDYKTGSPPKPDQMRYFDRQLPIEAVMAEHGGFESVAAAEVAHVTHIGLGRSPETRDTELTQSDDRDFRTVTILGELARLLASFDSGTKGYSARRAMEKLRFDGDYDHLARFGEWDETKRPVTVHLP